MIKLIKSLNKIEGKKILNAVMNTGCENENEKIILYFDDNTAIIICAAVLWVQYHLTPFELLEFGFINFDQFKEIINKQLGENVNFLDSKTEIESLKMLAERHGYKLEKI